MPSPQHRFDPSRFINPSQAGGIESVVLDDGEQRGIRALYVNTGGGLRFRVLADRGLDIDRAFLNQYSLAFLTHKGPTRPSRAFDRGVDWLKSFPGGLLTSCGPTNIGGPCNDGGEEVGLHGIHSNTPAAVESVVGPDPHGGREEMLIVGRVKYGGFYGPNLELRRTIRCELGKNRIEFTDEFVNLANTTTPHAWLLHINFGYPLLDEGSEMCFDAQKVEPIPGCERSARRFASIPASKRIPAPMKEQDGADSFVGYVYPKPDKAGRATVGLVNKKLNLGVAVHYNTREFPSCANWQHFGEREYVAALEPSTGGVQGRDKDRAAGVLQFLKPMQRKTYRYAIEVLTGRESIGNLLALNRR